VIGVFQLDIFFLFSLSWNFEEHGRRLGHFWRPRLPGRCHRNPEEPHGSGSVIRRQRIALKMKRILSIENLFLRQKYLGKTASMWFSCWLVQRT